jgi:hypothetical protein
MEPSCVPSWHRSTQKHCCNLLLPEANHFELQAWHGIQAWQSDSCHLKSRRADRTRTSKPALGAATAVAAAEPPPLAAAAAALPPPCGCGGCLLPPLLSAPLALCPGLTFFFGIRDTGLGRLAFFQRSCALSCCLSRRPACCSSSSPSSTPFCRATLCSSAWLGTWCRYSSCQQQQQQQQQQQARARQQLSAWQGSKQQRRAAYRIREQHSGRSGSIWPHSHFH